MQGFRRTHIAVVSVLVACVTQFAGVDAAAPQVVNAFHTRTQLLQGSMKMDISVATVIFDPGWGTPASDRGSRSHTCMQPVFEGCDAVVWHGQADLPWCEWPSGVEFDSQGRRVRRRRWQWLGCVNGRPDANHLGRILAKYVDPVARRN